MADPEHWRCPPITKPVFSKIKAEPFEVTGYEPKPFLDDADIDNVWLFAGTDRKPARLKKEHDVHGTADLKIDETVDVNERLEQLLEREEYDLDEFCAAQAKKIEHNSLTRDAVWFGQHLTAMTVTSVAAWLLHTYKAFSVDEAIAMCGMGDVPPLCQAALERIQTKEHTAKFDKDCSVREFAREFKVDPLLDPLLDPARPSKAKRQCELVLPPQKRSKRTAKRPLHFDEHADPRSPDVSP